VTPAEIDALERQINVLQDQLREARSEATGEVADIYEFAVAEGVKHLSELFQDKQDLILIHNMGRSCVYCTSYADALSGITDHLMSRSALVMVSPDSPADQREFAAGRGWHFPMVSDPDSKFTADMGFASEQGLSPGFSCYYKHEDGRIERTGFSYYCPGDEFNPIWTMFSLLKDGDQSWSPRYKY